MSANKAACAVRTLLVLVMGRECGIEEWRHARQREKQQAITVRSRRRRGNPAGGDLERRCASLSSLDCRASLAMTEFGDIFEMPHREQSFDAKPEHYSFAAESPARSCHRPQVRTLYQPPAQSAFLLRFWRLSRDLYWSSMAISMRLS